MKGFFGVLISLFLGWPLPAQTPLEIVKAMEKKMFPNSKTEMVLVSINDKGDREEYRMTSFSKDNNQKIIVRFTAPARAVGNDILLLEKNVWVYDSPSGRIVKVPANLSFGGTGFSYGDVLRLNFSDNYDVALTGQDTDGWHLELTAKDRDAPYYRILLVIDKAYNAVKGTCLTRGGDVVKELFYGDLKDPGTGIKPVTVTVKSPLDKVEKSTLTLVKETEKDYPDNIFNKRNLSARLEEKF